MLLETPCYSVQADSRHTVPSLSQACSPIIAYTSNSKVLGQTLARIGNLPEHASVLLIKDRLHLQEVIRGNINLIFIANSTSSLRSSSNLRLGGRLARGQLRLLRLELLLPLCMSTSGGMISGLLPIRRATLRAFGYVPTRSEHWFPLPLYWQLVHSPLPSARSGTMHWAEGPSDLGDWQDAQASSLVLGQKRWWAMARASMDVR
jgi:hypothetical protein